MSQVVIPRAHSAKIRSVNPFSAVGSLRTIRGQNVPLRPLGTARPTAPAPASIVLGVVPLRPSPLPRPAVPWFA